MNKIEVKLAAKAKMPTEYGNFDIGVFENNKDDKEHIVLIKGTILEDDVIPVRIHSECFTGDVLGSRKCDCGQQLYKSMELIEREGKGIIIYLRQEGRGIGLKNKIKAYALQEKGYDTVQANLELGFSSDLREYEIAAKILQNLGVTRIKLITNNPDKIVAMEEQDIKVVDRIAVKIPYPKESLTYMRTKKEKMNHLVEL